MITLFENFKNTFIPINMNGLERIYYKIKIDNSIKKLDFALDKLKLKNLFYQDYNLFHTLKIIDGVDIIYLLFDRYEDGSWSFDIITDENFINKMNFTTTSEYDIYGRTFGGEINVTNKDIKLNQFNL